MSYLCYPIINKKKMRIFIAIIFTLLALPCASQTYQELCNIAKEYCGKKEYRKAVTYYARALNAATNDNERVQALSQQGYAFELDGRSNAAAQAYKRALEIDSTSAPLLMKRANLLLQTDSIQAAIDCYNRIERIVPDNKDILFFRAYAYTTQNEFGKAKRDYIALLAHRPDDTEARMGLALLYHKEGSMNECLMLLEAMIEEQPQNAGIYAMRSNIELEEKQHELALIDIEKSIELEPENTEYHNIKADILHAMGRKEAAKRSREKAAKLSVTRDRE